MATIITVNQGFDENYYLTAKAAQLTATTGQAWNAATTLQAITAAGLTPAEHYSLYGYNEGLSPNSYYNDAQYAASKAAAAGMTTDEFRTAWYNASGSTNLYTHYMQYGAFEAGVNPSTGFNDASYYAAKAAHDGTTVQQAMDAIQGAGLNAVSHYLLYGQYEGLNFNPTPQPDAPQVLTLNADNFSGTTFSAPLVFNAPGGALAETLQSIDTLTGSGTTAALNASLQNLGGGAAPMPIMTNVATVNLTSYLNGSALDATLTHGTTTWGDVNSACSLNINNIQELPSSFVMQNVTNAPFTASIINNAMTGTGDAVALSLNGVTNAGNLSTFTIANANAGTAVIETLNINTTGAASTLQDIVLPISGVNGLTTVNITGNQNLTVVNQLDPTITTVDANSFTGNLTLNLSASTNPLTVTGGSGNDTFNLAAATNVTVQGGAGNDSFNFGTQLDGLDVIDGGTGTNTLRANIQGQAVTGLQVTNIQNLQLDNANANGSIDLNGVTGITTLRMGDSIVAGRNAFVDTVDHAGAGITTVNYITNDATNNHFLNGLTISNSYSGTADTVAVNINNGGTALQTGNAFTVGNLNLAGVEHLGITVADGNATIGTINSSTMTDLTLTASGNLTTGTIGNLSNLPAGTNTITAVDATHVTGNANIGTITGLANGATITLGNGTTNAVTVDTNAHNAITDVVNVIGGAGADTITVGATGGIWNSFVTGGARADTINVAANAGVDTINYTHLTDSIISTGIDTVTGFASGVDKFDVSAVQYAAIHAGGGLTAVAAAGTGDLATDLGGALNAGNLIANGASVVTIAGGTDAGVYLVLNDGTAGFNAANDAVVHLVGTAALVANDFV